MGEGKKKKGVCFILVLGYSAVRLIKRLPFQIALCRNSWPTVTGSQRAGVRRLASWPRGPLSLNGGCKSFEITTKPFAFLKCFCGRPLVLIYAPFCSANIISPLFICQTEEKACPSGRMMIERLFLSPQRHLGFLIGTPPHPPRPSTCPWPHPREDPGCGSLLPSSTRGVGFG